MSVVKKIHLIWILLTINSSYAAAIVEDPKAEMIDECSILKYVDLPIKVLCATVYWSLEVSPT